MPLFFPRVRPLPYRLRKNDPPLPLNRRPPTIVNASSPLPALLIPCLTKKRARTGHGSEYIGGYKHHDLSAGKEIPAASPVLGRVRWVNEARSVARIIFFLVVMFVFRSELVPSPSDSLSNWTLQHPPSTSQVPLIQGHSHANNNEDEETPPK